MTTDYYDEANKLGELRTNERAFREAVKGDQSFTAWALHILQNKFINNESLTKFELDVLVWFINNILKSKQGINIACGADKKRGVGKRGDKARYLASKVFFHAADNKEQNVPLSMEKIWETVAIEKNVSESAVKKAWMEWKDRLHEDYDQVVEILRSKK